MADPQKAFDASKISAPTDVNRIGEWLMEQVDAVLESAIAKPIEQLTTSIGPVMIIGLTLQFLFYAYALQRGHGHITVTEFIHKYIKIAIIAAIATAGGFYQTTISTTMISLFLIGDSRTLSTMVRMLFFSL